ncbi:beta-N-acetylhexosaminidase [Chitinophaga flava]|uniref:beta-N-acetylhexosaminidase n=1 Tax=Chitinophaga flava TaxID=2259036 RepID=A0A365XY83_9BACT|nr:beta-N-acetylhexosaminidase [Chitinophaga flava]RBL91293.1 glycoside hydrolase family 20 [Chitinophaga flava]
MLRFQSVVFSSLLLLATTAQRLQAQRLIPQPSQITATTGVFKLSGATAVISGKSAGEAKYLQESIKNRTRLTLPLQSAAQTNYIRLSLDAKLDSTLGKEGYLLKVTPAGATITAASDAGIFYGIQSLQQLITFKDDSYIIDGVDIQDKPRFGWRAFMLDEARHFKGTAAVKKLLEEMAALKMNTFHWHLTDDQGWRIEIKKYPLLTKVGGHRDSTQTGSWSSTVYDGKPHDGFYTQEQIRDIIAFAATRHITIIPEIEMPGHSSAAIAAYPWLGTRHQQISVPGKFGVHYDVFNVSDPKVVTFLQDVLQEVISLFPSKVIHIGGDEVKYDQWKADANVQAYMQSHQLATPADLQIAFTNDISVFLAGKQRRMMGWNEIMGAKLHEYNDTKDVGTKQLAPGTIVHFWKGDLKLITDAVSKGYDVVNSYHAATYLDYDYTQISLEGAYKFDPIPAGLDAKYHSKILGVGCQMWGEWIPDEMAMEEKVYPRLAAYAEDGWTQSSNKNFKEFKEALNNFYSRWSNHSIYYHRN